MKINSSTFFFIFLLISIIASGSILTGLAFQAGYPITAGALVLCCFGCAAGLWAEMKDDDND